MKTPSATYRVQLSADFNFRQLRAIVPYLDALGVNCVYASPIFVARAGSTHGYDVTNPLDVNPEIGSLQELRELSRELKARNMLWLQDIVPNHMALDSSNPWIADILERGPASGHYTSFDIDWEHYDDWRNSKLMLPSLGGNVREVIDNEELQLEYEGRFYFTYYDHRFPASEFTYLFVLPFVMSHVSGETNLQDLEGKFRAVADQVEDADEWLRAKAALAKSIASDRDLADALRKALEKINSTPHLLHGVLEQQHFFLAHWQTTEREINYRRFFTINDLICLRMEDDQVFENYHQLIRKLCEDGVFDGLRVDHIDGLFDPAGYLEKLRTSVGDDVYILIEKILEWDERIPLKWPIEGTSGYGFLAAASRLFTDISGERIFEENYRKLVPDRPGYHDLVFDKKQFIIHQRMGGELSNLLRLMKQQELWPAHADDGRMRDALAAFLSAFPVYRIYPHDFPLAERQKRRIEQAYEQALEKFSGHREELKALYKIFTGEHIHKEEALYFLQRCQQFTGPLAAKGVEDTTFYLYNKHISRNEVGDSPEDFGIDTTAFHQRMQGRQENFPRGMNTTATHDTKRGEDARLRINALSEMPQEWFEKVGEWRNIKRQFVRNGPDANEEYFIYQALIGAWPADDIIDEDFLQRTEQYLQKVLREAKQHSNWSQPDEAYENSVFQFVRHILDDKTFRESFDPFVQRLRYYGMIYSLGQSLLKITAPGIPDIYQGTELWDLSYVDPDNRRPVDYRLRQEQLPQLSDADGEGFRYNWKDARLKHFVLHRALVERKNNLPVFLEGAYLPVGASAKVLAFIRQQGNRYYLVVISRQVVQLCPQAEWPLGQKWQDESLELPAGTAGAWQDIFTGRTIDANENTLKLADVLETLPVAFLKNIEE